MGTRLVVVPYDTLKFGDKKVMLPGGTKEGLKMLPEFKYATGCQRRRECASAGRNKNASLTMRGATVLRDAGFSGVTAN
jgi:hypothetical protein